VRHIVKIKIFYIFEMRLMCKGYMFSMWVMIFIAKSFIYFLVDYECGMVSFSNFLMFVLNHQSFLCTVCNAFHIMYFFYYDGSRFINIFLMKLGVATWAQYWVLFGLGLVVWSNTWFSKRKGREWWKKYNV
jgi:hypothetical protein